MPKFLHIGSHWRQVYTLSCSRLGLDNILFEDLGSKAQVQNVRRLLFDESHGFSRNFNKDSTDEVFTKFGRKEAGCRELVETVLGSGD